VKGDHDIFITGMGADGEAAGVVGVEFVNVSSSDVYTFCCGEHAVLR